MVSDRETTEAKAVAVEAIVQWSVIGARERAEVLANLKNVGDVFSLQDLLMFWADECPEILRMLLKAGADKYLEAEEDHAPTPGRDQIERMKEAHQRIDNSPQAILRRAAQMDQR